MKVWLEISWLDKSVVIEMSMYKVCKSKDFVPYWKKLEANSFFFFFPLLSCPFSFPHSIFTVFYIIKFISKKYEKITNKKTRTTGSSQLMAKRENGISVACHDLCKPSHPCDWKKKSLWKFVWSRKTVVLGRIVLKRRKAAYFSFNPGTSCKVSAWGSPDLYLWKCLIPNTWLKASIFLTPV